MRKKSPIVVEKLIEDSTGELKGMQEELEGQSAQPRGHRKPGQWSQRFAPSGKRPCVPALSYEP